MEQCYIELRKSRARGTDSIVADSMRHLHTRQHLGKAVVVCDQPVVMLSAARKQWLKLSRIIQKQRAQTLNADKILKYTHTITHMQHMQFSARSPLEKPDADVYFVSPRELRLVPVHCWSTYIIEPVAAEQAAMLVAQLPSEALIVDYDQSVTWRRLGLQPKKALEARVAQAWQQVLQFLRGYDIDIARLTIDDMQNIEAMDDALDTLLGISHSFLQVANEFQRALELARPLRLSSQVRTAYDTFVLLAHRVQALSPTAYTQHFLEAYNEDDTFFLYDVQQHSGRLTTETLARAYARHQAAGRHHLARALLHRASSPLEPTYSGTLPAV
ncbi:MAG TPA: hypothetical protein VKQ34_04135 [Candidatus Saccharimonadales bacterium]|nr:hypothetical protein [Candidatus Saccharimonadales bacterium]